MIRVGVSRGAPERGGYPSVRPKQKGCIHLKQVYRGVQALVDGNGELHEVDGIKVTVQTQREDAPVENGTFFKVWVESGVEGLEDAEIGFLVRIMKYVDHRDNTIRKDGEVMTVREMAEVMGREYTRFSKMVKGLLERKVMGKHSTEIVEYKGRRSVVYSINPYVACKGRMLNKQVRDYFAG